MVPPARNEVIVVTLTTERLILRPWVESDAESLYEYASNGKIVSAGAIMGGVYLAFASLDNPDETVLYFNESALNCITFSSATVALKDPISINVGGHFFLERNGSKLLSAGRYAPISPYYRKLLYEYRPVS